MAEPQVNSVASLHGIETFNRAVCITDNIIIEGQVVANDAFGEFSHRVIIQDASGGVEILCDDDKLYSLYPIGVRLRVSCNGLYISSYNGVVRLGGAPTIDYSMGYLSPLEMNQHICAVGLESLAVPTTVAVGDISFYHISTLVALDEVMIESECETFCTRDSLSGESVNTVHRIVDGAGDSIALRINKNAIYADEPLPSGKGLIYVIVDYVDDAFSVTISNARLLF